MGQLLIDGKVELRLLEDGSFDELVLRDKAGREGIVHAEMMNKGSLWIGIHPPGETDRRVCMWITADGDRLKIIAEED